MKKIYFIVLFGAILGCASPQKLIDRAIKKDPTIVNGYSDTLRVVSYKVDSIPYEVAGEIRYRDTLIPVYKDTVINCNEISIERKKTRFEIRKNFRLQKNAQNLQFKIDKLEKRNEKLQSKLDAKTEQKKTDQVEKTKRTTTRQENKRNGFFWLWVGLLVGIVAAIVLFFLLKKAKLFLFK